MEVRTDIFEFGYRSFHTVSENEYDNYEGFDAYPILTKPMYKDQSLPKIESKKKDIIYI